MFYQCIEHMSLFFGGRPRFIAQASLYSAHHLSSLRHNQHSSAITFQLRLSTVHNIKHKTMSKSLYEYDHGHTDSQKTECLRRLIAGKGIRPHTIYSTKRWNSIRYVICIETWKTFDKKSLKTLAMLHSL